MSIVIFYPIFWGCLCLFFVKICCESRFSHVFPLHGAVFLPHAAAPGDDKNPTLANLESVRPILDVAIADAHKRYLRQWIPRRTEWLTILSSPIKECEDQKTAAWAGLQAVQWTNGSGLDISFGPACDYVLATVSRILSFYKVPMFTNAGFSEFFQSKEDQLLTRVGPLQDHITMMIDKFTKKFKWKRPQLMYEKNFWESELREAGFCKLLMNGMYLWSAEKKWDLQVNPKLLPSHLENPRRFYREFLIDTVGVNHGGWFSHWGRKIESVACFDSDFLP